MFLLQVTSEEGTLPSWALTKKLAGGGAGDFYVSSATACTSSGCCSTLHLFGLLGSVGSQTTSTTSLTLREGGFWGLLLPSSMPPGARACTSMSSCMACEALTSCSGLVSLHRACRPPQEVLFQPCDMVKPRHFEPNAEVCSFTVHACKFGLSHSFQRHSHQG